MNTTISFKQVDPSDALKQFIEGKSVSLEKYFNGKISITWIISSERQNRIAHCHLVGNQMDYFGEGITDDFKASVDLALEKIEKQLRKHKEIVTGHKNGNGYVP